MESGHSQQSAFKERARTVAPLSSTSSGSTPWYCSGFLCTRDQPTKLKEISWTYQGYANLAREDV